MNTHDLKEMQCRKAQYQEREFDRVQGDFAQTQEAISKAGKCQHVFTKLGCTVLSKPRQCERENGHSGAHMFGLWRIK